MALIISLSALLLSVVFVQIGVGSLGPLDALAGAALGFTSSEIGYLGSSHFVGFLVGCLINPIIIRQAGHARAFAVMASIGAISTIMHSMTDNLFIWCLLRIFAGFAVAGAYTVIESWLQSKVDKKNRGTVFGMYRSFEIAGTMISQGVIAVLDPSSYIAYNVIAMVCCISLLPLALTRSVPPTLPDKMRIRPFFALALSPLGALAVAVSGLSNAAFRMVGPVYATESGLERADIAVFLSMGFLGGALAQMPIGLLSDRINRRYVLTGLSVLAMIVCGFVTFSSELMHDATTLYVVSFVFGAATIPIYSVAASHTSDFAEKDQYVDLSSSLIFMHALGAIISPAISGLLIDIYGPSMLFTFIGIAHVLLLLYAFRRMLVRPAKAVKSHAYVPRTSLFIHQIMRHQKGRIDKPEDRS